MNTQQRVAAGVMGAVVGLAVGFISQKDTIYPLILWIVSFPEDVAGWLIGGVIVGVAITFLRR